MSESSSALTLIADDDEFRFARFYIVYEGVQLGRLESPPIVFGVSDMSPLDCPNVEQTRNPMQISGRKKCSHFFTKSLPSAFPSEIARHDFLVLLHITPKGDCPFHAAAPLFGLFYFSCIQTRIWFKPRLPHAK